MKKKFLKNLSFFVTLNLIIKPVFVFGIDRVVQNKVGAEIYGSYFPLLNLVLIFQIFLDLGIENYSRKEIAENPGLTNRLFSNFLVLKIVLSLLFIAIFSVVGFLLPQSRYEWKLLLILLLNQSMANFILYLRANMGGLQLFRSETVVSVLDRSIMILVCGGLLLIPYTYAHFKMEWFVLSQTVAYAVTLLISIMVVLRKTGRIKLNLNWRSFKSIFRRLKLYALLVLLMAFYYRVDSIFLRFLLEDGKLQAGIYAHGFRILDFMSNYALIFSFILLPTFARMIRRKENTGSLLRFASLALFIPSISILSGVFYYRFEVFSLLYTEHVALSANVFGIMIISFLGIGVSYTFGALLTANGNLRELNIMAVFAVLISISLNSILIPRYEVIGAAIANAVAQMFTIVYHIYVVKQKFKLTTDIQIMVKVLLFILFSALMGYLISETHLKWYIGIFVVSVVSLLFSVLIRLLKIEYLRDLFKRNLDT